MDSSFLNIPQFAAMNQVPAPVSTFTGNLTPSTDASLPKILTVSSHPQGNIVLHEVTKLVILLTVPHGVNLDTKLVQKGNKAYKTTIGEQTGYVFYKNTKAHMDELDKLFGDDSWKANLSEPLPEPTVAKEPVLLIRQQILHNGIAMNASLYEYSDKSLALFCAGDPSNGDDKLLKPFRSLACPESPSGKANGYLVFKNNAKMINFVKSIFMNTTFESLYTKSPAIQTPTVAAKLEPIFLGERTFQDNGMILKVEFFEYSPLAIALFPEPMFKIGDLTVTNNLKYGTGVKDGYIIAKANTSSMLSVKTHLQFPNIEELFTLTTASENLKDNTAVMTNSLSDMTVKNYSDIPLETLVRLINVKMQGISQVKVNDLINDRTIIVGPNDAVVEKFDSLYSDCETLTHIQSGDNTLILLKRDEN